MATKQKTATKKPKTGSEVLNAKFLLLDGKRVNVHDETKMFMGNHVKRVEWAWKMIKSGAEVEL